MAAHLAGVAAAWWLIAPNTRLTNSVALACLALTVIWIRFVVARRNHRLASEYEDLTPNLITHGGLGGGSRWDRRSRRQDEAGGAETRAGNSV